MDLDFLIYQKREELWLLLLTSWNQDIPSFRYLGILAFIVLYYYLWYRLTDKQRLVDLLLYGSLITVSWTLVDTFGVLAGLWLYKHRTLPLLHDVFLRDWTITPLTYMLVQQYSPNWRQFFIWNAVGAGVLAFVIIPLLHIAGFYHLIHYNYIYIFLSYYLVAALMRAAFHLAVQVQEKARENNPSPLQSTIMQPAFKPMDDKQEKNP